MTNLKLNYFAISIILLSSICDDSHSRPISSPEVPNKQQKRSPDSAGNNDSAALDKNAASQYLLRFGYSDKKINLKQISGMSAMKENLLNGNEFKSAISEFQEFAGIPQTGRLDSITQKYMLKSRCGTRDKRLSNEDGARRRKRFAFMGSTWKQKTITYKIFRYPVKYLDKKSVVDQQIAKAFAHWSRVANLNFVPKRSGKVHIEIRFLRGEHGDGDPFDGPSGTLAHAFEPAGRGTTHFDDTENWSTNTGYGVDILQVAVHEFGHALGLSHSKIRGAIMAPIYQYNKRFRLHQDDIQGMQKLYGSRKKNDFGDIKAEDEKTDNHKVNFCKDGSIDAITTTENGKTYAFKGQHYWIIDEYGSVVDGSLAQISSGWPGLPDNIDTALTRPNGKTYFFKGDQYWRFNDTKMVENYPKKISEGFPGIPDNLSAAFTWGLNGKTYFFKGDKFYKFVYEEEPPVSSDYPKSIALWEGLPSSGVDAAINWKDGVTYFFKGQEHYRFDDKLGSVDTTAEPKYPRPNAEWWFGCKNRRDGPEQLVEGEDDQKFNENFPLLLSGKFDDTESSNDSDFATSKVAAPPLKFQAPRVNKLAEQEAVDSKPKEQSKKAFSP